MATCKECLHFEVCRVVDAYGDEGAVDCSQFKDRTKYVEQVCGRWENYPSHAYRRCSVCKIEFEKPKFGVRANYCPNCSAKMDETKGEAE